MKIRNGFVSNSSSSSFIMAYSNAYKLDDPNLMDKISNKDGITVKRYGGDSYVYYTLTDDDKKKFFEDIDSYKDELCSYVYIDVEDLEEEFNITPEMVGKHVTSSAGPDGFVDYFDIDSESIDEFIESN